MRSLLFPLLAVLLSAACMCSAFTVTPLFGVARTGVCTSLDMAKHVQKKAARKSNHNRPKKKRLSDINRAPTNYPTFEKPPEYTISDKEPTDVSKPAAAGES